MTKAPKPRPSPGKPQQRRVSRGADLGGGRVNQKLRTRDALVGVAADFIRRGMSISVAEVADAARVSRTTAYRYFATPELLRTQAALFAAGRIETTALDRLTQGPGSPEEKLDALIAGSDAMTAAHEAEFRSLLRLSLEPAGRGHALPRRPQFRRSWLSSALSELERELGEPRFSRLIAALGLMCGIESVVVLQDVFQLRPAEASDIKRWAARLLLRAAIHEAADGRAGARSKPQSHDVKGRVPREGV